MEKIPSGNSNMTISAETNIKRFFAFRFFSRFYFYFPVLVVFFYTQGLSAFETGCLISIYSLTVVIFSMLSGTISEKYGRKNFLVCGEVFKVIGLVLLATANNVILLGAGQFFSGLGFALVAGTDSAFLYENYATLNKDDEYRKAEASSQSLLFFATLIASIIGALVSMYDLRLPFILTIPFNIISAIIALTFTELESKKKESSTISLKLFFSLLFKEKEVVNYVFLYAAVRSVIMTVFIGLLPLYLFNTLKVGLHYFGAFFAIYMLVGYYFGKYENKIENKVGVNVYKIIIILVVSLALYLFAIVDTQIGILIPILLFVAAGSIRPLATGNINLLLKEKSIRGATLSFAEFSFGLLNVISLLICFYVYGEYSLMMAFCSLLTLFIILCGIILLCDSKLRLRKTHYMTNS